MTTDYIAFHAAECLDAVAVIIDGREITCAHCARDIRRLTRALREFELPRGAKALIDVADVTTAWGLM
jgi:non-ribosomal peptide synthetase component E (peptide arylation enzyme)